MAQLILWAHALAALLFAAGALAAWRRAGMARVLFTVASALTALWALAVAGIGAGDLGTRTVEAARDLGWLAFAFALVRGDRTGRWMVAAVYLVVSSVAIAGAVLAAGEAIARTPAAAAELSAARLVFRMMAAAGGLVLARHLHAMSAQRGPVRLIATALALLWGSGLALAIVTYTRPDWEEGATALRGLAAVTVAALLGLAAQRRDAWVLALSRPAATRALIAVALATYIGFAAALSAIAAHWGGRPLQAAVVVGAATALLTLASTSWLGAWAKVKLAKHLFRHRYDYRVEWQRFTDTLSQAGEPLEARVVAAVARLLDAPGGVLLAADGDRLVSATAWRWDAAVEADAALTAVLATGRIVELDPARSGAGEKVPAAMLSVTDAWALVPLLQGEALIGAVVLARPPVPRALDWEDFDLLRVAGRQAASYLAEDRAGRALAEARRFEEFNRRFAFILHDIKNLVSQQLLVARNAERHAANPAFRADMVATLKESADRMTALLAKLAHQDRGAAEACAPVDAAALIERVARTWRAQHPIECVAVPLCVEAQAGRLEQVLAHLVQNAVEASADDSPVMLTVAVAGDRVAIEVADRGGGMSAAFVRDELFRPFASTKAGGFGIGAFEARQLVTAMGGTLTVDSREGKGTCFRILLPAAANMEKAA
ncbi:XrtA/PEP-CTERM system histidine kinase PrsK [Sphingomonas sp.]|uniref:XrtA/PEP-CTERM system histidine kinase PrsK n=1 Tax=Sphingomonas sp. TaxID=28214 RepID=UPI003CC6993A